MPRRARRPPRPGLLAETRPLRILAQILALQAVYYAAALVLTVFSCLAAGTPMLEVDAGTKRWKITGMVLGWESVRGDTAQGFVSALVWLLDGGFVMVIAMVLIVARSKLIPDFALTFHFIHLVVVTFYSGRLPRNALWWLTMVVSAALAVVIGMWACQRRELLPISFGGSGGGTGGEVAGAGAAIGNGIAVGQGNGEARPADGDEEMGYSRGRGRGRGRDGGGDYEMVGLKPKDEDRRLD